MPTESYSNPLAPLDHKAPDDGAEIALEDKRRHGEKKKKAHFYVKHENEDELLEILKKYRDRARERRDGELKEYQHELELITATGGYRAVAPDIKACLDAAERRKQMIEESKYLGGDIEHTHLVKGLDYALLQKVRSEISAKQIEEVEVEKVYQATKSEREEVESQVKSPLAKNIYALLFKAEVPKVNDMFAPRRMAYVVELDDNSVDTDIPTTLIRSKQECPVDEASANLSINDMVIQKLTQVLAYLRTDSKRKKKGKDKIEDDSHLTSKSPAISTPHK
ncbi:unnamed protein product [Soboliphyme baturini]|uniref:RED_N domain-containing protein n=1 Tax=Soboliphyme baturini TaxID=241478 RepID=A0A183IQ20_9BILA|nr:unnamed protein product [Soboliphyme baturini]